ncbi:MAG: hypothetical protein E6R04_09640 [Spirochaetes bacterium]|nr:MAG: hypothetical protein E6R04_09640 [Spirochaetota bacterium]
MAKITIANQTEPTTPSSGNTFVYVDSVTKTIKSKDDAGVVTAYGAGGGGGTLDEAKRVDNVGDAVWYHGWAAIGTATSAASWKICKVTLTGDDAATTWADGNADYDNVWDNRASLSYS